MGVKKKWGPLLINNNNGNLKKLFKKENVF